MVNTVDDGDTWDYWGKVYSSAGMRSELLQSVQDEPRLGHLLDRYQKGQSTKVVFSNVANCTNLEMKNLLEAELGRATVNHIRFAKNNTATVHFYLTSVAQTAKMKFDGRRFRGSTLHVSFWNDPHKIFAAPPHQPPVKDGVIPYDAPVAAPPAKPAPVPPSPKPQQQASKRAKKEALKSQKQTTQPVTSKTGEASVPQMSTPSSQAKKQTVKVMKCANEWDEMCKMSLSALCAVLQNEGPLYVHGSRCKQVIGQLCSQDQKLAAWPLGLLRLCSPVVIHGAWLCMPGQKPPMQQQPMLSFREPWEPMTPDSARTPADITSYLRAALGHFGWMDGSDLRLCLIQAQLTFPLDKMSLLTHMRLNAHIFCNINNTVFLINQANHRNAARKLILTHSHN